MPPFPLGGFLEAPPWCAEVIDFVLIIYTGVYLLFIYFFTLVIPLFGRPVPVAWGAELGILFFFIFL